MNQQGMGKLVPDEQDIPENGHVHCVIDFVNRIAQKALDLCITGDDKFLLPPRFVSEHSTRL